MKTKSLLFLTLLLSAQLLAQIEVKHIFMIPMRDGVELSTDVYAPADTTINYPVILYRTPYNKGFDVLPAATITTLNNKGYVLVVQDCRGRYASEGVDSIFFNDGWGNLQDGFDTIEWIKNQEWCNGKIGMYGYSAPGITTLRALGAGHPNLVCAAPAMAASDFYHQTVYEGGELRKAITEFFVTFQQSPHMMNFYLDNPYYNDSWETMNLSTRSHLSSIPVLFFGGWYDCFSTGTIQAYKDESSKPDANNTQLVMGPWTHAFGLGGTIGELNFPNHNYDYNADVFLWFDHWLLGDQNGINERSSVKYYLMGDPDKTDEIGCQWIEAETWPPQNIQWTNYYLAEDSSLSKTSASAETEYSYSYDPNNPVPTKGGNNLSIPAGPVNQNDNNNRTDVITFESELINDPLRIEGHTKVELNFSSDKTDTDVFVKLLDVYPDGRSILIAEGIQRLRFRNGFREEDELLLTPNEIVNLNFEMQPTAHVFNSGHKIQISITSSNYPRFEVNPNTGADPNNRENKLIANNKIHFGGTYLSKIILPVIENATSVSGNENYKPVTDYKLHNNYPNPFNGSTHIAYSIPENDFIELAIYNINGEKVRDVTSGNRNPGKYSAYWDGKDNDGYSVSSGVYFYLLKTTNFYNVKKMIFLK